MERGVSQDGLDVFASESTIRTRVAEIADQISRAYPGEEVVGVCTLNGSYIFFSDIIRLVRVPVVPTFLATANYGAAPDNTGEVRIAFDLTCAIQNRHVIVFEGAVVSGLTLNYLLDWLRVRRPASLRACSLVTKPDSFRVDVKVDYVGFTASQEVLAGYGIGYRGKYAQLPYLVDVQATKNAAPPSTAA